MNTGEYSSDTYNAQVHRRRAQNEEKIFVQFLHGCQSIDISTTADSEERLQRLVSVDDTRCREYLDEAMPDERAEQCQLERQRATSP